MSWLKARAVITDTATETYGIYKPYLNNKNLNSIFSLNYSQEFFHDF